MGIMFIHEDVSTGFDNKKEIYKSRWAGPGVQSRP
jgi:hypothetical protein